MLEFWGDVGFLLFTFSALVFTVVYLSLSNAWRKTMAGAIIATFAVSVTILCGYLSLRIWDIDVPGVEWVRFILFWVLGITMLTSIIGFLEVQFGRRGVNFRNRLGKRYDDVKDSEHTN
jgi:hypothetical protein